MWEQASGFPFFFVLETGTPVAVTEVPQTVAEHTSFSSFSLHGIGKKPHPNSHIHSVFSRVFLYQDVSIYIVENVSVFFHQSFYSHGSSGCLFVYFILY
jgi:hypothetical protein